MTLGIFMCIIIFIGIIGLIVFSIIEANCIKTKKQKRILTSIFVIFIAMLVIIGIKEFDHISKNETVLSKECINQYEIVDYMYIKDTNDALLMNITYIDENNDKYNITLKPSQYTTVDDNNLYCLYEEKIRYNGYFTKKEITLNHHVIGIKK